MSVEKQVAEYMKGWHIGAMPVDNGDGLVEHYKPKGMWTDNMERGFRDARKLQQAAEQSERERLERCPTCGGKRTVLDALGNVAGKCPDCHDTGKRREP